VNSIIHLSFDISSSAVFNLMIGLQQLSCFSIIYHIYHISNDIYD